MSVGLIFKATRFTHITCILCNCVWEQTDGIQVQQEDEETKYICEECLENISEVVTDIRLNSIRK